MYNAVLYCLSVRKLTNNHRQRFVACVLCYFKMYQISITSLCKFRATIYYMLFELI